MENQQPIIVQEATEPTVRLSVAARLLPMALRAGAMTGYRFGRATERADQIYKKAQQEIRDIATAFEPADTTDPEAQHNSESANPTPGSITPLRAIGKNALRAGLQTAMTIALEAAGERLTADRPNGVKPSRTARALGGTATALSRGMPRS